MQKTQPRTYVIAAFIALLSMIPVAWHIGYSTGLEGSLSATQTQVRAVGAEPFGQPDFSLPPKGLYYTGEKQSTTVFPSTGTIKESYTLYADFLNKGGWTVSNTYESDTLSSLYGKKENEDITITITKGQVSISVLQK